MSNAAPLDRKRRGFDGSVSTRVEDHLNRWPFAREIYYLASNSPKEWSVRIGIYGEWGMGKSSVLRFTSSMASDDGHVVVWFDPWAYSTKTELWQAFVLAVFRELEAKLGAVPGGSDVRLKAIAGKTRTVLGKLSGAVSDTTGDMIGGGLELLRRHFAFSADDLTSLQAVLGNRRVMVMIDDLDRTAPQLVPEILFALKELMDVPGFAFICAFDPVVVGKVLHQYHEGFGDGLKFLDKIIDFPRWLAPIRPDSLIALAASDIAQFCDYVPPQHLDHVIPLLPPNPRAVRQYVRLLTTLRPQIARHHDWELNWPIILAANVIKISYPQLAPALLREGKFWEEVEQTLLIAKGDDEPKEITKLVEERIDHAVASAGVTIDSNQRKQIAAAIRSLCSHVEGFTVNLQSILDQIELAEAPHAVTWKEYDDFLRAWNETKTADGISNWIKNHNLKVERSRQRIFREIFEAALRTYPKALRDAENTLIASELPPLLAKVESLMALLETLALEVPSVTDTEPNLGRDELKRLVETFSALIDATASTYHKYWPRCEALLIHLIEAWPGDLSDLVEVIHPYDSFGIDAFDRKGGKALHKRLCDVLLPKMATQLIRGLREPGFITGRVARDYNFRHLLFLVDGPLWSARRIEAVATFSEAKTNQAIQGNAYDMLRRCHDELDPNNSGRDAKAVQALLSDSTILRALWESATVNSLGALPLVRLQALPERLATLGIYLDHPLWGVERPK